MADFSGTLVSGLGISEDNLARKILTLDTITDFDDTVGDFDDAEGDFDLGGTDATSNPNYYAANIARQLLSLVV